MLAYCSSWAACVHNPFTAQAALVEPLEEAVFSRRLRNASSRKSSISLGRVMLRFCPDERLSAKIMLLPTKMEPKIEDWIPNQTATLLCSAGKLNTLCKLDVPDLLPKVLWRRSSAGGSILACQDDTPARNKRALTWVRQFWLEMKWLTPKS